MEARHKGDRGIAWIKLRAHHILCVLGFRGMGYNSSFVENFARVMDAAKGSIVELVDGGDAICAACPNFNGSCTKGEAEVKAMDAKVLSLLGYSTGTGVDFEKAKLEAKAIPWNTRQEICSGCEWLEYCERGNVEDTYQH